MNEEQIRQMLTDLEKGLVDLRRDEDAARTARLRQEGAILILRQMLQRIGMAAGEGERDDQVS